MDTDQFILEGQQTVARLRLENHNRYLRGMVMDDDLDLRSDGPSRLIEPVLVGGHAIVPRRRRWPFGSVFDPLGRHHVFLAHLLSDRQGKKPAMHGTS